jgi:large subunit ribosomal protein L25
VVELTWLEIGDNIRIADIKLPASAQWVADPEIVVASVTGIQAEVTEEAEEAAGEEAAAGEAAAEADGGEA